MTNTTINYFEGCTTLVELRNEYIKLCKINHPDNGGKNEILAQINNQYKDLFNKFKDKNNKEAETNENIHKINEMPEEFINIVSKIISLDGIIIELCGSWLWIDGETKKNKETLTEAGFHYAPKKKKWYWRDEKDAVKSTGKSMEYIREKYGSQKFQNQKTYLIKEN